MTNYAQAKANLLAAAQAQSDTLRNELCQPLLLLHPEPTPKVCLFFHGFTAAPYQFGPMGQALFKAGYNVIAPLMPGHGQAGDWSAENPEPLPTDAAAYQTFAEQWLGLVAALGGSVIVGGLSGGGTLTAWLGLTHPDKIDKTLLYAPYLSSSHRIIDLYTRKADGYQSWEIPPSAPQPPGYSGFAIAALRVFLEMGRDVLRQAKETTFAPMFVISSESDRAVSSSDHKLLFERVVERQPRSWYLCFDRVNDIPHTMMTQAEGNDYEFLLIALSKGFIESDLTWPEIAQVAGYMAKGETFNAAVEVLGFGQRVSPDMPTVMTMLDKRSLLERQD